MTSGPSLPNLKRPWEVESTPPPRRLSTLGSPLRTRPDNRVYGQDVSGWHYEPFQGPMQVWNRATPTGHPMPHELHYKRTRLDFDHDEPFNPDSGTLPKSPLSCERPRLREHFAPHAAALGPVLSLGYMPTMPSRPEYDRKQPPQSVPGPVLPSPISISGSIVLPQAPVPSLPSIVPPGPATSRIPASLPPPPPLAPPPPPPPLPPAQLPGRHEDAPVQFTAAEHDLRRLYEDLMKEHDRVKARLVTYDRKSKAADQELAILHEEKFALQDRVNTLEKELDETRQQKNEVREFHIREGAQWRQIISLSNTLQQQHTEEADKWREERNEMAGRIESLEDQIKKMRVASAANSTESGSQLGAEDESLATRDDIIGGGSFLSREVQRIRAQEEHARHRLREYQQGSRELKDLLSRVKGIMERLDNADAECQ